MPEPAFYADEHVHYSAIKILGERGIDIISVHDSGMRGRKDSEQFDFAVSQERAIIT